MQQFAPHRLRELREERGFSQASLAYAIRRDALTYRNYEYGKRSPNAMTLGVLADVLGVRVEDLFEEVPRGEEAA